MPRPQSLLASVPAADRRAALAVAAIATLLALPYLAGFNALDEGLMMHVADRLADGEVLYRDVATGVGPGSFYLQALLFKLFGRSLLVGRIFMILLFASTALLSYGLCRQVAGRAVALPAALCFVAISAGFWRYPGYSSEAIFFLFLGLAAAVAYLRSRRGRWLFLAGLAVGATGLIKQNYGAFAGLGLAAALLVPAVPWRERLRDVFLAGAWTAVPVLLTVAAFAAAGALDDFWQSTVLVPLLLPSTLFLRSYPPLWGESAELREYLIEYLPFQDLAVEFSLWLHLHMGFSLAVVRLFYYLPPTFLLLALGLWCWRARRGAAPGDAAAGGRHGLALGMLFLASSALLFFGVFPRADVHHLILVLPPFFLLLAWALADVGRSARALLQATTVLLLGVSAASQVAVVADYEPHRRRDAFIDLPRARVFVDRGLAKEIRRTVEQIQEQVPADAEIFVAPGQPIYYFLADRDSPTRYPLILPGALDEQEVLDDLAEVDYALLSDFAFGGVGFEQGAPRVWDYLYRNFGPAPGADWDTDPLAPYLRQRDHPAARGPTQLLRGSARPPSHAVAPESWLEFESLMQDTLAEPPPHQAESLEAWLDPQPKRVSWDLLYLQPSLVMRAPWGQKKLLATWEVPVTPGLAFEFACALAPIWGTPGQEGQGGIAEVWVWPEEAGAAPQRAWFRWLDPRRRAEDRRWRRGSIDLASFVTGRRARVTLVAGPAPTLDGADALVGWTDLRLVQLDPGRSLAPGQEPVRPVRLTPAEAQGVLGYQAGDLAMFREAAEAYPDLAGAQAALGRRAAEQGRDELAVEALGRAAELDPGSALYRIQLAQALDRLGRIDEATAAMQSAVEVDAGVAQSHAALAELLRRTGRGEAARSAAQRALEIEDDHGWALTILSTLEREAGNLEAAEQAARRAVEANPGNVWVYFGLFEVLQAAGRHDEAVGVLEQADALEPVAAARLSLARGFLRAGAPRQARDQARLAVTASPESAPAWQTLAEAAAALGDEAESLRARERLRALAPAG